MATRVRTGSGARRAVATWLLAALLVALAGPAPTGRNAPHGVRSVPVETVALESGLPALDDLPRDAVVRVPPSAAPVDAPAPSLDAAFPFATVRLAVSGWDTWSTTLPPPSTLRS